MLTLEGERFTSGRWRFADQHPRFPEQTAKIYVKVQFPGIEKAWIAQSGELVEVPITLIADEGTSLDLVAMFFVSRDWRGGTFLGYTGLLERLRIALDCPANQFYFGVED